MRKKGLKKGSESQYKSQCVCSIFLLLLLLYPSFGLIGFDYAPGFWEQRHLRNGHLCDTPC